MRNISRLFLMADITRRLKAPDPTIRLGPSSSCLKSLKTMPTMLSRISGADLRRKNSFIQVKYPKSHLGPRDIRTMFAMVPFHTGTSITSCCPSGPDTVIFLVVEVMASMEHMKMSATMNTATKL